MSATEGCAHLYGTVKACHVVCCGEGRMHSRNPPLWMNSNEWALPPFLMPHHMHAAFHGCSLPMFGLLRLQAEAAAAQLMFQHRPHAAASGNGIAAGRSALLAQLLDEAGRIMAAAAPSNNAATTTAAPAASSMDNFVSASSGSGSSNSRGGHGSNKASRQASMSISGMCGAVSAVASVPPLVPFCPCWSHIAAQHAADAAGASSSTSTAEAGKAQRPGPPQQQPRLCALQDCLEAGRRARPCAQ